MSRNLLPQLRHTPTPANIPLGTPGRWARVSAPGELAKLEFGHEHEYHLRSRIQSVPSPWARLLLFKHALEDPSHPARTLVRHELLDALELIWSLGTLNVSTRLERISHHWLTQIGQNGPSLRVESFATALAELVPRRSGGEPAMQAITILLVNGRPVLGTSPYTVLFTAEDAAGDDLGRLFLYARGAQARTLAQRPAEFGNYISQVILPQLREPSNDPDVAWTVVQQLVKPWLEEEARNAAINVTVDGDWRGRAASLGLEPIQAQPLGGMVLYKQRAGAAIRNSRWRLRSERRQAISPLVLHRQSFDGVFYSGAPNIGGLPQGVESLSRDQLPVLGILHPWIHPETDWFTDYLVLVAVPLELANVKGFRGYRSHLGANDREFGLPRLVLPLRSDFFRYFTPDDVDRMLTIEVQADRSIVFTLLVEVGTDEHHEQIAVSRRYESTAVLRDLAPELVLWPSFQSDRWRDYVLFRKDATQHVADHYRVQGYRAGERLESDREKRTPLVEVTTLHAAPDVIELRRAVLQGMTQDEPVGVLLPRFREAVPDTNTRWHVGIDFGTSNTVVSVREDGTPAADLFSGQEMTLPLTQPSPEARALATAYFFPDAIESRPFGTAVVHLRELPTFDLSADRTGLRVNIPFTGHVDGYHTNQVAGDLKWSAQLSAHFLSGAFLRHLVASVLARALQRGVVPVNVTLSWSYPRAFTMTQVNRMQALWTQVVSEFAHTGITQVALKPPVDESRAALRHFFNAGQIGPAGDAVAVVDVGGGTSDIAVYGRGRVLAFDSLLIGGRNLTGSRLQAAVAADLVNPFVERLVSWAVENGLPEEPDRKAIEAYRRDGQEHLAFSYLVASPWFRTHAALFTASPAYRGFQAMVLYFFGALHYYLGLSLRALSQEQGGTRQIPHMVMLAGNGSRYMEWLTDLQPAHGTTVFSKALSRLLVHGAAEDGDGERVNIQLTTIPKEEVARGLVALVDVGQLREEDASSTPVVGEAVAIGASAEEPEKVYQPASRFGADEQIAASQVSMLRWRDDGSEIERLHEGLLEVLPGLTPYGAHWADISRDLNRFFEGLSGPQLRAATVNRLQYLAEKHGGYRGSLFTLEAAVVLDRMRDEFIR